MKKVLVLTNSINGLYNFRKELIERLIYERYEVIIVAPVDEKTTFFKKIGCICKDVLINRRGINPFKDLHLLVRYMKILKDIKPNVVLTYTIKPNVYGGIACSLLKIPFIANITGLGTSIENGGILQKISLFLYKAGLKKASCVFFQNNNNKNFFQNKNLLVSKSKLIPGSGVNLEKNCFENYPCDDKIIKFLFIGRIMKAKGVEELFQAAKIVRKDYSNVEFHIVGRCEENYLPLIKELQENDIIKYYGYQRDVHSFIKNSHAIINPSYHEGMSNVLLEAASTGRPVLASRVPGCIETFDENVSGIGFEVKSVDSLVNAIVKFINLPYAQKKAMGIAGRKKMEKEFDRNIVVNAYMEEINRIINKEKKNESVREIG